MLRRLRDRVFWTPWTPRAATIVAVAICLLGAMIVSLERPSPERAAIMLLAGASWVALGAYERTRETSPMGGIAMIVGLAWFVGRLDQARDPALFTVGQVISLIDLPPTVLALITFPLGRLSRSPAALDPVTGRIDPRRVRDMRRFLIAMTVAALPLNLWVLFTPEPAPLCGCEGRNLMIADLPGLVMAIQALQTVAVLVLGVLLLRWFERALRLRGPLHRDAHEPMRIAVRAMVAAFAAYLIASATGSDDLTSWASLVSKVVFMCVPVLYGVGLFRWRQMEDVAAMALERSPAQGVEEVERALRRELRDPALRILTPPVAVDPGDPRRTEVHAPDGTVLAVAEHDIRVPDSTLLDRALAWAGRRLAPAGSTDHPDEVAAWRERIGALTDAELATVELLSRQRTNQQIADEFHLSLGTVQNRVSRIYVRLGLAALSRRERAAVVARLRDLIRAERERRTSANESP